MQMSESARSATIRNAEHFSTSQSAPGLYKSAIMQHAADAHHHFRSDDLRVVSRESDWHKRGIRESVFIRALSPSLNRNEGRHTLPHCYDSLLKQAIKKPPPPEPHQETEQLLNTTKRGPGRPRAAQPAQEREQTLPKTTVPALHVMTTRSRATRVTQGEGPT